MDIRHLTYFIAVAEHRSFTKAAESLHITQPTLSKMVRLLEQRLNVTLFDRSGKQIELTDAGRTILQSSRQIVRAFDNLSAELADVVQLKKGIIRFGLPPMVGGRFFPSIIERFHLKYPDIRLQLAEQGGKTIEQEVDSGELDLGMVVLPVDDERKFHFLHCLKEDVRLLVHTGHRLASRVQVQITELKQEPFILFREDFNLRYLILEECRRAGFEPEIVLESSQWDFITEMVASKFGVTLLPESVCRSLDPARFRTVPLLKSAIPWRLSMIWRKDKYLSYAAREWIRFMQSILEGKG